MEKIMNNRKRLEIALDLILLIAGFWVVRYWHSRHFGLYEDDLTIIPSAITMSFRGLVQFIYLFIVQFQGQGRPLHHSFIYLFSWMGWRIAGLWGLYLIGFLITAANIGLFYWLMHRVASRPFAILAGLGYILYAADTTQSYLTFSLGVQISITLLLLACHSYLSNKRLLAYLLALLILLGYETPFLIFLAVPLLKGEWNRHTIKELVYHGLAVGAMLAFIYFVRLRLTGHVGVVDLGRRQMLALALGHMLQGPLVSLWSYALRPIQVLHDLNWENALVVVLTFPVFLWFIARLPSVTSLRWHDLWSALKNPTARRALPEDLKSLGRMTLAGFVMLVMAYPLTFTVSTAAVSGRATRVHTAGVAGAAVLVASLSLLLIYLSNGSKWRKLVNGLIALELACMAGYGFVIQRDYVNAWQYQQNFWTELQPLIPDAGDGTAILVDPAALHDTLQIGANTWNLSRVLSQIYTFPQGIKTVPFVSRLPDGWQKSLVGADGQFQVTDGTMFVSGSPGKFDPQQVILIQAENGRLVRRETVTLKGQAYALKPVASPVLPTLPHGFLYSLMIIQP